MSSQLADMTRQTHPTTLSQLLKAGQLASQDSIKPQRALTNFTKLTPYQQHILAAAVVATNTLLKVVSTERLSANPPKQERLVIISPRQKRQLSNLRR
jgi:hypothetical protein